MTTAKAKVNTEISTKATKAAQEDVKINLPSLPDAFGEESLLNRFQEAETKARSVVPDVSTEEGRKNIKDMARKVAASNKALDTPMRDYLRILKTQPKALEKNARESKARFDTLKADILKPLSEAQASQDAIIEWLNGVPATCSDPSTLVEHLEHTIETIKGYTVDLVWPELKKKFKVAHESALTTATVTLERAKEAKAQADRLAELEAAAKLNEDEKAAGLLAEQAVKDEKAKSAKKAMKAAENRINTELNYDWVDFNGKVFPSAYYLTHHARITSIIIDDTWAPLSVEAQATKERVLAQLDETIRKVKGDEEAAAAQAVIDTENERVAAEKRQKLAVEQATAKETKRIADEEAEQAAQAKAREADKEHRIGINRAAMVDFIAAGLSEEDAKTAVRAIAKKQVRNISIQY